MSTARLGLPLEYTELSEYFDAINIHSNTELQNAFIEKILKTQHVCTVLDLTCGTGSQVIFLAQRGYQCVGSDLSLPLIKIAKKKAKQKQVAIQFFNGDMRILNLGKFDAVITIFNSIGHLTKTGFVKTLKNINRNLKVGGIYIFDIFNLEAMTPKAIASLSYHVHKTLNQTQIHLTQCSTLNRRKGILTSYDSYMLQKHAEKPIRIDAKFHLQIYRAKELQSILAHQGFEIIAQYGMDGSKFERDKTLNMLTVAKKIS